MLREEAVASRYNSLYMPVVNIIRQRQVLRHSPGLTEADLYPWIMDHRYYLNQEYGTEVGAETAATDLSTLWPM